MRNRHDSVARTLVGVLITAAVAFGWYGIFLAPIVLVVFVHFMRDVLRVLLGSDATTG